MPTHQFRTSARKNPAGWCTTFRVSFRESWVCGCCCASHLLHVMGWEPLGSVPTVLIVLPVYDRDRD